MKNLRYLAAYAAFALAVAASANTAVSIVPNPGNTFNNGAGYTLGYEFTVGSTAIDVTSLGYFNDGSLSENHAVGIYDTNGNLLLSGTVAAGSSATDYFSWTSSLSGSDLLAANTTYVIGGVSGFSDPYSFSPLSFSTDPDVTFNEDLFVDTGSDTLTFPTTSEFSGTTPAFFGPNFEFSTSTTVPGPAAVAPFLLGLFAAARRRKSA